MFNTPDEAREFLGRLGVLSKSRTIVGEEREQVLTMLRLIKPEVSNNQRFYTETWQVGDGWYYLHSGDGIDELEERINDIQQN